MLHTIVRPGLSTGSSSVQPRKPSAGRVWLLGCLILAGTFLGLDDQDSQPESNRQSDSAAVGAPTEYVTRSIRDVRVGQRVLAENPELNASDRQQAVEPDPATWKQVSLLLADADGLKVEIELLRSPDWLAENRVEPGGVIQLDLEELGASGEARVLAVSDCPLIEQGSGQVVTGTFAHQATEVLDLLIDGQAAPIGTTPNHPFWSNDRQRFVAAGDLRPGESLRTADGSQQTVRSITSRGDEHTVYNLEVNREHVYYVGDSGILVHNSKLSQARNLLSRLWKDEVGSIDVPRTVGANAANRGGSRLNIFGEGEAPAYRDVSPEELFANGRPLTQGMPSGAARDILIHDAPITGPMNPNTLSEIDRLAGSGTRISLNQAAAGSQADVLLERFAGRSSVIKDVLIEKDGVMRRVLQILID